MTELCSQLDTRTLPYKCHFGGEQLQIDMATYVMEVKERRCHDRVGVTPYLRVEDGLAPAPSRHRRGLVSVAVVRGADVSADTNPTHVLQRKSHSTII